MDMFTDKIISIVVPVYNSEECVQTLVGRMDECLNGVEYELVLVNDCSPDRSWEEIKKAAQSNKSAVGINLRKNAGQDNAIMAGLSRARGDYAVIMDDDLQHDPADIKLLVQELERTDSDVCFARFQKKKQRHWKNLGSWFNGKMAEIIIKKPRDLYLSPFKAIRKEVVDEIIKYNGPYPYVDGILFTITRNVSQIDVEHHGRHAGEGNYTLRKSINVWLKLMTNFSVFPLRIATFVGFMASASGFLLAIFYFARYFFVGEQVLGWTSLILVTLILCGTILLALGAVGEYIGRSYILLNRRPQYTIKEISFTEDRQQKGYVRSGRREN
jgi:undecaprenyl-phosphate 4-deoxy-4-formamido-L-arabinose transferase